MNIKKLFSISFIVIFFYIIAHQLQLIIYSGNFLSDQINTYAYSIYIPHGLRILFFLIYGYWCLPGLLIAHLLASFNIEWSSFFDLSYSVLIPTICVPMSALIVEKFIKNIQNKFTMSYLFLITILSTFINGFLTNVLRYYLVYDENIGRFINELSGYFIGDILGVIIIVLGYLILKRIFIISVDKNS
jgi:integral membrane sensor domain MASE1